MVDQFINEVATDSIHRVGFPLCKVFIYGQEVTQDIISVRVNQAGGSTERTPSTCTITLANPKDKYILHHQDIVNIAKKKNLIGGGWQDFNSTHITAEYHNPNLGALTEDHNIHNLWLKGTHIDLPDHVLRELAEKLRVASDDELYTIMQVVLLENDVKGAADVTLSEAQALADHVIRNRKKFAAVTEDSVLDAWEGLDLTYKIKQEVVTKKLEYTTTLKKPEGEQAHTIVQQEDRMIYDFPMSEGDCIFNLNDPVRVAFRDPFDPRIWYWMFTGFMDSWTENTNANFDSEISITCTDVTKMARYAIVQLNTGLLDPNLESFLGGVAKEGGQTVAQTGVTLSQQIFKNLSIPEILEVIFFGTDSAKHLISNSGFSIAELTEIIVASSAVTDLANSFSSNSTSELSKLLTNLFMETFNLSLEEAEKIMPTALDYILSESNDMSTLKNKVAKVYTNTSLTQINTLDWYGISSPRNVAFKRKNENSGLHIYVYGTPGNSDIAFGAIGIQDLFNWNEELHHRVRESDLKIMLDEGDFPNNTAYSLLPEVTYKSTNPIEQVIQRIGTDIEKYPVGHGRVMYMAPAKMADVLGDGILDRAFSGVGSMHSTFKDRLTYLYDLADIVEWRFYATPRGDVLFEMPFYDFDPDVFFGSLDQSINMSNTYVEGITDYTQTFKEAYSGTYSDSASLPDLTDLALELNTLDSDTAYVVEPSFDYAKHFTIEIPEQSSYSNTNTDKGLLTVYRATNNIAANWGILNNNKDVLTYKYAIDKSLVPTLGVRLDQGSLWSFAEGAVAAEMYSAVMLNKRNSAARNIGVNTLPKFGLMVNRPLNWVYRNYYANIVSMSHSLVWNSDINTSINLNQVRTWSGDVDKSTNNPVYRHFGDSNRPFDLVEFLSRSKNQDKQNKQEGV